MTNWKEFWCSLLWLNQGTIPVVAWRNWGKPKIKTSVRIACVPVEVRVEHCRIHAQSLIYRPTCSVRLFAKLLLSRYVLYIFIHSAMVLQPFVGPWPLLQFRKLLYTDCRTPWTSDQPVARPLTTHRINAHRHQCLGWGSKPRSQRSSERRRFMP
jgi:hypothetical protein